MAWLTASCKDVLLPIYDSVFVAAAVVAAVVSVTSIQFSVHVQELHALAWTGQETVTQTKACGGSLEGNALENQAVLPAGMPMEATLGQCGVDSDSEGWPLQ